MGWDGAIYHNNGHAKFFNNTLINSRGKAIQVLDSLSLSTEIKNNVLIQEAGISNNYIDFSQGDNTPDVGNNVYFGGTSSAYAGDLNPIISAPKVTVESKTCAYAIKLNLLLLKQGKQKNRVMLNG